MATRGGVFFKFGSMVILLTLIFFISNFFTKAALADGCLLVLDRGWNLGFEKRQRCAINWSEGREKMILQIDYQFAPGATKRVWVFPVPGGESDISLDILKGFPVFHGINLHEEANKISTLMLGETAWLSLGPMFSAVTFPFSVRSTMGSLSEKFTVHRRVEKYGFVTELVSLKNHEGLSRYLTKRDLDLPEAMNRLVKSYIGTDFCFVFTWINPAGTVISRPSLGYASFRDTAQPSEEAVTSAADVGAPVSKGKLIDHEVSIYVTFKSEDIFFPLKLTSIYGDSIIPVEIDYVGFIKDAFPDWINDNASMEYYLSSGYRELGMNDNSDRDLKAISADFLKGKDTSKKGEFSRILIKAPARNYEDDLRLDPKEAVTPRLTVLLIDNKYLTVALFLFFFQLMASRKTVKLDPLTCGSLATVLTMLSSFLGHYVLWFNYSFFAGESETEELRFSYTPKNFIGSIIALTVIFLTLETGGGPVSFFRDYLGIKGFSVALLMVALRVFMVYYVMRMTFSLALEGSRAGELNSYNYPRAMLFVILSLSLAIIGFIGYRFHAFPFLPELFWCAVIIVMHPIAFFFAFNCTEYFSIFSRESNYLPCSRGSVAGILTMRHLSMFWSMSFVTAFINYFFVSNLLGKF